ncbi:hypothetical protein IHV25_07040 [Phaeovibrio sulfidiphilus]|uniref:Uncharacterized protein n=1 Tax=Phaeovibrio sulfidiphilus TaxID=1220600 RepID=A0A8J6YJC3_9PROT|nr:hypothetical protein [Phaeovibrio sulfidiphilus]MBE1237401.1 hypothetical protein [Phaeovibrio sulfidiphilus]
MEKTGSTDDRLKRLDQNLLAERSAWYRHHACEAKPGEWARCLVHLSNTLRDIGKTGDLNLILESERRCLENEKAFADTPTFRGSLEVSLLELEAARRLAHKVRDPEVYRTVDAEATLPKNRVGGLPRDEARQFYRSHAARFVNQDKHRMIPEERALMEQRKLNIRAAEKTYVALQEAALGRERSTPTKG